ncbi:MAG: hypothetical protein DI539_11070 [Flavobacterium psychrophilum]|nr:MAG: hypothetical protein DI539_11070 [Flavobacterium psychrophilum]
MYVEECKSIVSSILNAQTQEDYISSAEGLSDFYGKLVTSDEYLTQDNEVAVKGGVALSGLHAAACVDDFFRTVSFIKGVHKAINKLIDMFPERTINILYAGTGPYATLILPLLPLFDKDRLSVIFLDINDQSVESVRKLIESFGLTDYDLDFAVADATTYVIPEHFPADLVVSETMHYGLTLEPQVAIVKNLAPQMPPHAILIPQEIHIDFGYSFFAYEPFVSKFADIPKGYKNLQPYEYRTIVDRLFTINKELFRNQINHESRFVSDFYPIPEKYDNHPDACVFTGVTILDDIRLKTAESLITNPYCIISLLHLSGSSQIQLTYDFSDMPKWTYAVQ